MSAIKDSEHRKRRSDAAQAAYGDDEPKDSPVTWQRVRKVCNQVYANAPPTVTPYVRISTMEDWNAQSKAPSHRTIRFGRLDEHGNPDEPKEYAYCTIVNGGAAFYPPSSEERREIKERRQNGALNRCVKSYHWCEVCTLTELVALFPSLRFVSLGDGRITDCAVARMDGNFTRVQLKSWRMPGKDDRRGLRTGYGAEGKYENMRFIIGVHEYVIDERMQQFIVDMTEDPLHVPRWRLKYVYLARDQEHLPRKRSLSMTESIQEAVWKDFRIDVTKPEEVAKGCKILSTWIDQDDRKASLQDMLVDVDDGMRDSELVEHKCFETLCELCGEGWDVIPNPRKAEETDVLIRRNDGAILLVSMKTAGRNKRAESARKINHKYETNWEHIDILIALDEEHIYAIEPARAHEKQFFHWSKTNNADIHENAIRISAEDAQQKVREMLTAIPHKYTIAHLKQAYPNLVPFANIA